MKKEFEGWLGINYEDTGLFSTKKDADRGICPEERLYELLHDFDGKKVKIIIEVLED